VSPNTLLARKKGDSLECLPLVIKNGKLYQVLENQDEEEESWELHIHEIK